MKELIDELTEALNKFPHQSFAWDKLDKAITAIKKLTEYNGEQPFYLKGKTIYKRPVSRKEGDKTITSLGFPVCTVSEYADENMMLDFFNKNAS